MAKHDCPDCRRRTAALSTEELQRSGELCETCAALARELGRGSLKMVAVYACLFIGILAVLLIFTAIIIVVAPRLIGGA